MKKLILIGLCMLLLLGSVSAFEFDNVLKHKQQGKYGKLEIVNMYGLGSTLADYTLTKNSDQCFVSCYAEGVATLYVGGVLFKEFDFVNNKGKKKPLDYTILIKKAGEKWQIYDKKELKSGEYYWKIEAMKGVNDNIDWAFESMGIKSSEIREHWAWWSSPAPVRYWKLDEGNGEANDSSGYGYNLSNTGVDFVTGKIGNASAFDGISDILNGTSDLNFEDGEFTVATWFNTSGCPGGSSYCGIVSNAYPHEGSSHGFSLELLSVGGKVSVIVRDGSGSKTLENGTDYSDNDWHFLVVTRDANDNITMYIDNVEAGNITTNINVTSSANNFSIGATLDPTSGTTHTFNGSIDDVAIYNYSIDEETIDILWNSGNGRGHDSKLLSVTQLSPADNIYSDGQNINFSCNASSDNILGENITNLNFTIYNITGGIDYEVNYSFEVDDTNFTTQSFLRNLTVDGNWTWTCAVEDTFPDSETTSNRTITVDNINPNITLTEPILEGNLSNISLGFVLEESNLDSCWYALDYGSNTSFTCSGSDNTTIDSSLTSYGYHNLTLYVNDSVNNLNFTTREFLLIEKLLDNFTATAIEGDSERFELIINDSTNFNPSVNLTYNATNYVASLVDVTGDNKTYRVSIVLPNIAGASETKSFNWTVSGTVRSNYDTYRYETNSHTITTFDIDNCTVNGHVILNFTMEDEETRSSTASGISNSSSIETDVTLTSLKDSSVYWNYSITESNNNLTICVPTSSLDDKSFRMDVVTKYSADDHVVEYNYIDNFTLINTTVQHITLYDLATVDSTSFLVEYKDQFFLPIEDAVVDVWRYYVGDGEFLSVEHGKTNEDGETVLHLVTEDVIYRFYVRKNGELLYTSPDYNVVCPSAPCEINLKESIDDLDHPDFSQYKNLLYDPPEINTTSREVTFTFITIDGSVATIGMNVTLSDAYMNLTVCTDTTTSSGGTLSCTVPSIYTNSTFYVEVWKDGEFVFFDFVNLLPEQEQRGTLLILSAGFVSTLALLAYSSGIFVVIFTIIGVIFASALMIFSGGSIFGIGSAVMGIIVAGGILIWKLAGRRSA